MALELKVPHGEDRASLWPVFLSYILSFVNVDIYWNNHHHLFQAVRHVGGWVLWANLHLLFWLSLMPFAAGFMGENHFAPVPVFVYAVDLLMCAVDYTGLVLALVGHHGRDSDFARALGQGRKKQISTVSHILSVPFARVFPSLSLLLIANVAVIWVVPDRRIARVATKA